MKILAIADRRPDAPLEELLAEGPDLVVCCGDLERSWLEPLRGAGVPAVGVYGNHCLGGYLAELGIEDLHARAVRWPSGLTMAGLEGCPRYKVTPHFQYDEEEVESFLAPLPTVDLFVAHCPPRGVNDTSDPTDVAHMGWRALRAHLREHPSRWLIHGHTYPTRELERFGETEVYYVSGHRFIEIEAPPRARS